MNSWQMYALGSAFFAGLTAILGKIGVQHINSDVATFIRTIVILAITALLISFKGQWISIQKVNSHSYLFLVLSGIATGASWLCYYRALQLGPASKVAPVDKLSVVFVIILAIVFLGEKLTVKSFLGALLISSGALILTL